MPHHCWTFLWKGTWERLHWALTRESRFALKQYYKKKIFGWIFVMDFKRTIFSASWLGKIEDDWKLGARLNVSLNIGWTLHLCECLSVQDVDEPQIVHPHKHKYDCYQNSFRDRNTNINTSTVSQGVSVQDVEEPEIVHPSQILIEVRAASLDPVDLKVVLWLRKFSSFYQWFISLLQVSQGFGRGLRELVINNPAANKNLWILQTQVNRYNPNTGSQFPVILGRDGTGSTRLPPCIT